MWTENIKMDNTKIKIMLGEINVMKIENIEINVC